MVVRQYDNPADFLHKAGPFLTEHEPENSLLLGIATRLADHGAYPGLDPSPPFLATIEDQNQLALAALRCSPHLLCLSPAEPIPVAVLADWLARKRHDLPGVVGPAQSADVFATAWKKLSRQNIDPGRTLRLYTANHVIPPPSVPGQLTPGTPDELDLLIAWYTAFLTEVGEPLVFNVRQVIQTALAEQRLFVWRDPQPTSIVTWGRPTANSACINMVYTFPEFRQHGYATAAVAALTQQLLNSGRKFCTLFTNLANPTTNHIYRKIGYRPITDFREWRFSTPS